MGVGIYKSKNLFEREKSYEVWKGMLKRCYDEKIRYKNPTYRNVTVSEEWHNFQNFAKWYHDNLPYRIKGISFQLDKDLLQQGIENKVYSPDTCVFLPHNVNSFLSNKQARNTSGYIGVSFDKKSKSCCWQSSIRLFNCKTHLYLGRFQTPEDASKAYQEAREIEVEKAKNYLRSLNYLPEYIIQLIR